MLWGVCVCLQTCTSVVYMLVMRLYSTWTKFDGHIYHGYPVICKSIYTLLCITEVALLLFTHKLILTRLSDPTCVQNFRPVSLMVFEIQGLKLNNNNNNNNKQKKNNWRNGLFTISPMFVVQFS